MRRRPFQYVLFVVGIALGVAMMVSIDVANSSASRAFQLSADSVTGRTTHRIVGGPTGLDEAVYRQIRTDIGYQLSAPVVEGLVSVEELGTQPYRLVGIDPFAEPPFRSYLGNDAASGAGLGAFISQPNTILLSAEITTINNLDLGDTLTLNANGNLSAMTVVGLIEATDDLTRRGLQGLIFADIATAQETLSMVGKLSRIDLIAEADANLDPIASVLPTGTQIEPAAARSNTLQQMTAAFELNLTALSMLALVVGMFLIYNTVTFSVVQRRPIFGILRCLGVTGGQLALLILTEAFVLGLIGSLIGLGTGVILGRGMVNLVTQTINDLYFTVTVRDIAIPTFTLVKGVVIGVIAALIASALPAIEALRTPPNSTLRRSSLESKVVDFLPRLTLGGIVIATLGVLLLWQGNGLISAFTGLLVILLAAALVTPPITVLFMRGNASVANRWLGVLARMAPRDIMRSLSRTSIAIAALMTAVSVIVGVSIMIGSFRQTVVQWLDQTLRADIYISPPNANANTVEGSVDPEILAQAFAWEGIERGVTARQVRVFAPDFGRTVNLVGASGDVSRGNRQFLWRSTTDYDTLWQQLSAGEGVFISEPFLRRHNLPIPPPPLRLSTPDGEREFPVLGVHFDYSSDQGVVLIGGETYATLWNDDLKSSLALFVEDDAPIDDIVSAMQAEFSPIQVVDVRSNRALRDNSIEIFDRTFAITAALRLLATVVAFIGVLSALMSLQLERARELGTLRATGMTKGQLWRLTFLETGLMGSIAGLIAMPVGYVLAWVLIYVINLRSFGWTLNMYLQPSYFIQAVIIAVSAALLAGIYPSMRLGNMQITTALRSD